MTNPLLLILLTATLETATAPVKQTVELERYVSYFLQHWPKRRAAALKLVPIIVAESNKHGIAPLLVGVVITKESSWRTDVKGKIGEHGLMQVHGLAARGYDMKTPRGQIAAGVAWLAYCLKTCGGDMLRGLSAYQTGKCRPVIRSARWRYRAYLKAVEMFGEERER